jgi:hypothetical protein
MCLGHFQLAVPFISESHDKAQFSRNFCRCLKDVSRPADITPAVWSVPLWASECLMEMHSGMRGGELGRWQLSGNGSGGSQVGARCLEWQVL